MRDNVTSYIRDKVTRREKSIVLVFILPGGWLDEDHINLLLCSALFS